jgi:nucleoside-diphosphate-sugar epimerase
MKRVEDAGRHNPRISAGDGEIKHPRGIDMPRKGALDISRAAKVFGFRPRYDLRTGLEAYVRDV